MVAEADDGPRGDPEMPLERRNKYENLILLCNADHKIIDDQFNQYSVTVLQQMKAEHESWVAAKLEFDCEKQHDDLVYADYIDRWVELAHLDIWTAWSSWILCHSRPKLSKNVESDLSSLRNWLLGRIWPGRYSDIETAFENFFLVLRDFQETFREYAAPIHDGEWLLTEKFYKIDRWDEAAYSRLVKEYEWHVDLVGDLMLELTRSANLICDRIRETLAPSFRLAEGRLIVQSGPDMNFQFSDFVVQYSADERASQHPYPGLKNFQTERAKREIHFGSGEMN